MKNVKIIPMIEEASVIVNIEKSKLHIPKWYKESSQKIKGLEKINAQGSYDVTTRLKHTIVAVNGDRDTATVREFAENMLARDVKALREQINKVMPDVDMKVNAVKSNGDVVEGIDLPIGVSFFWPDSGV